MAQSPQHTSPEHPGLVIDTSFESLDFDVVHGFLVRSYWSPGISRDVVVAAARGSMTWGVLDGGRQIGYARAVTDRATFAWLADVFVLESNRGRGIGQWLIQTIVSHPDLQGLRRWLLATRDAHAIYSPVGFCALAQPSRFMEIHRPNVYVESGDRNPS